MLVKERRHPRGAKNSITLEQLLSKEQLSDLERYILELSKEREPSWEVVVIHKKTDENTARGSLAKLQTAIFTSLTKKLRDKQGALLGKCDTLYVALKKALDLNLITNHEYTRGIRINSATNMAKHRVEPDPKVVRANEKKNLNASDSDQEVDELEISDADSSNQSSDNKKHSDSDNSDQKEPIEDLNQRARNLNLKGYQQKFFKDPDAQKRQQSSDEESSEKDVFAQNKKGIKKPLPAENLVEKIKNENLALQHELIELILRGDLPEVKRLVKKGASLRGLSFKERYQQIEDWSVKLRQSKESKDDFSPASRKHATRDIKQTPITKLDFNKIICPLTAAVIGLNEEILNYVKQQLGPELNWNLVCCDLLLKNFLLYQSQIASPGYFTMLYRYDFNRKRAVAVSDALTAHNPGDDITIIILLDNLLAWDRTFFNPFEKVYFAYHELCMDKIDQRPATANYEWLAKWYQKYACESWVPAYNQAIYREANISWSTLIKTLVNDQKLFDSVGARSHEEKWDNVNKKNALIPFPEEHDRVVTNILEKKRVLKEEILKQLTLSQENYNATVYKNKEHQTPGADIKVIIDKMMPHILESANTKLLKYGSFTVESSDNQVKMTYTAKQNYPVIIEPFQNGRSRKTAVIHSPTPEQLYSDIEKQLKWFCDRLYIRDLNNMPIVTASLGFKSTTITLSSEPAILGYLLLGLQKSNIVGEVAKQEQRLRF